MNRYIQNKLLSKRAVHKKTPMSQMQAIFNQMFVSKLAPESFL